MEDVSSCWSCGIPKQSIKLLTRIITCIEKFSSDLIVDISTEGMVFRAVNKSRSGFCQFKFDSTFFDSFSPCDGSRCLLLKVKPCLAIFRSYGHINRCVMSLNEIDCRVVFDLECTFGVKKSHLLTYNDTDAIQCNFVKETSNKVSCDPKTLSYLLAYFHGSNEEVSFIFDRNRFTLRTYVELDELSKDQVVQTTRTELALEPTEFKEYRIESSGEEIVISLKEAKAVCTFAEALGQAISLHFDKAGKPLMFTTKYYNFLECDFIMATFGVDEPEVGRSQTTTSTSPSAYDKPCTSPGITSDSYLSALAPPQTPEPCTKSGTSEVQTVSTPSTWDTSRSNNGLFVAMDESDSDESM